MGLELLTEASNLAAVQRVLQTNPYWASFHPHAASLISTIDTLLPNHHHNNPAQGGDNAPSVAGVIDPRQALPVGYLFPSAGLQGSGSLSGALAGLNTGLEKRG